MQIDFERAKQIVSKLPIGDLEKFDDWYEQEKLHKSSNGDAHVNVRQPDLRNFELAKKWLAENGSQYVNLWVCIEKGQLIASGADGHEVYQKALTQGIKAPLIHFVEAEPEAYWGGWL